MPMLAGRHCLIIPAKQELNFSWSLHLPLIIILIGHVSFLGRIPPNSEEARQNGITNVNSFYDSSVAVRILLVDFARLNLRIRKSPLIKLIPPSSLFMKYRRNQPKQSALHYDHYHINIPISDVGLMFRVLEEVEVWE